MTTFSRIRLTRTEIEAHCHRECRLSSPSSDELGRGSCRTDFVKALPALGPQGLRRRKLGLNEPAISIRLGNNSTHKKARLGVRGKVAEELVAQEPLGNAAPLPGEGQFCKPIGT